MSGDPHAGPRLVLDYIKAFMWPFVIVVALLLYHNEIKLIVSEREVDIFGLKIGGKVEEIKEHAELELEDIRALLEQISSEETTQEEKTELIETASAKIDTFQQNINREVDQVQQAAGPAKERAENQPGNSIELERVKKLEEAGFEAIKQRDYRKAQRAFASAYKLYPEYHNVDEINRLLQQYQDRLQSGDSRAWEVVQKKIITDYSWGLQKDVRPDYRQAISPKRQ